MNTSTQNSKQTFLIIVLMMLAAFTRLVPHAPNFTAIMAVALFGGVKFKRTSYAVLIPLSVMLLTDMFIGFYSLMPVVYGCIALTSLIGIYIRKSANPFVIIVVSILSSILFFMVTNAAVWYHDPLHTQDMKGLLACYNEGIPFFKNQLFGDLFF